LKIHDVIQGTTAWSELRAGIPTASEFDRIITPTGKPSKSQEGYRLELLAERLMGHPSVEFTSSWMERGSHMEAEAVSFYEFQRDCQTTKVGFVTNDEETVGASPDRMVGEDGLLETKVPKASTHVGYLLFRTVDRVYFPQIQGQLWVTGRKWADILSYHPEMPPALIHVERDEAFIKSLADEVMKFSDVLESEYQRLLDKGFTAKAQPVRVPTLVDILKKSLCDLNARQGAV
jgi:hypothetical protein